MSALFIALSVFVFFVKIGESFCSAKNVVFFIDVVNKESCVMLMEIRDFFSWANTSVRPYGFSAFMVSFSVPCRGRPVCLPKGLRGYLNLLYSCVVLNLYAFVFELFCSRSCLTFHRVKSYKNARHRQNKAQQPFARAVWRALGRPLFAAHSLSFKHRGQKNSLSTHQQQREKHRSNTICPLSDA